MASLTALFCLVYFEPGPSSRQKKQDVANVVETRSSIPEQYPSANDLHQDMGFGSNHFRQMSTDHDRQARGKKIKPEIVAIPAILAFPPEVCAQRDQLCELRGFTRHAVQGNDPRVHGLEVVSGARPAVQLIDEEDDSLRATNLIHLGLNSFFELAKIFCSG